MTIAKSYTGRFSCRYQKWKTKWTGSWPQSLIARSRLMKSCATLSMLRMTCRRAQVCYRPHHARMAQTNRLAKKDAHLRAVFGGAKRDRTAGFQTRAVFAYPLDYLLSSAHRDDDPPSRKQLLSRLVAVAFFMESLGAVILNTAVAIISQALKVALHSFGGEAQASNTPTIRRVILARRHQLSRISRKKVNYVLNVDISNFFDEVSPKWLRAGILEDGVRTVRDTGDCTGLGGVTTACQHLSTRRL